MMYAVYAVNKEGRTTIYNSSWLKVAEYGKGTQISNPVLTLEDNAAGTFECIMPPSNQGYDKIVNMATEIQICEVRFGQTGQAKVETEIWRGRVISSDEDFMNNLNISCEGELAYLRDVLQPQRKYPRTMTPTQFFGAILKVHNSKGGKKKAFELGYCEFLEWSESSAVSPYDYGDGSSEEDMYRITQYEDTLTVIENALVDLDLPHLRVRLENGKRYLDILQDERNGGTWGALRINNQAVRLGVNLLDCSKSYDSSDICSVIIPLGAQKEGDDAYLGDPITLTNYTVSGYSGAVLAPEDDEENGGRPIGLDDPDFKVAYISVSNVAQVFYTGRQWNGYGMYTFVDSNNEILECEFSDPSSNPNGAYTDIIEAVLEVPEGATRLYVSGCTNEIELRLNSYLSEADAEQYVTVKDVVDNTSGYHRKKAGEVYVINDELLSQYGWIERVINFESITDPVILYDRALTYFDELFENLVLEVKAVDMNYLDSSINPLRLGYCVPVVSAYHNLDLEFPISKLEIHIDDPSQSNVTLGYSTKKTFTGISVGSSARINKSIKDTASMIGTNMNHMSVELNAAIDEASYLIKNGMTGYVNLVRDPEDNDIIREIVISEDLEYTNPEVPCWRFNFGGLGFSPSGYNDNEFRTNVAMDMLGRIHADRITTGTMYAERIRGGTFKIGVVNDSLPAQASDRIESELQCYSVVDLYNGEGNPPIKSLEKVGEWDADGLSIFSYNASSGWNSLTGITDGEVRGYYRDGNSWHRAGTLNLVRRNQEMDSQNHQVVNGDVSLKAEDNDLYLVAGRDIIIRAEDRILFQVPNYNYDTGQWEYQTELFIDESGLNPRSGDNGCTGAFHATMNGSDHVFHFRNGVIYQID